MKASEPSQTELTPQQKIKAKPHKRRSRNRGTATKLTPQQKRFIDIFTKNVLAGGSKSIEDMLLEAGYSPQTAKQQTNIMAGIRPHTDPIVERIALHRERIMDRMEKQVDTADYGQLVRGLDVTIKSHRLLTGKTTQNLGVLIGDRRQAIDRLIDE